MIKQLSTITLSLGLCIAAQAQTVAFEENFTSGIPATWTVYNEDGLTPAESVSDFTAGWIGYVSGVDTAAASTSYYDPSGQANDFLVTPQLSLTSYSRFIWSARSVDASYPDGYQVLISTTDNTVASFTDTLLTVAGESALINRRTIELDAAGYANQDVYIAFQNNSTDGYILLIDDVTLLTAETASVSETTGVAVNIYPNPSSDFIQVNTTEQIEDISIYSMDGRLELSTNETQVDISSLVSGNYICVIQTANGVHTEQISKK